MNTQRGAAAAKHFDMSGEVAMITGGGSGLGLHFARCIGVEGAKVILLGRREEVLANACTQLSDEGIDAAYLPMSVDSPESVVSVFQELRSSPPTVLVNNAGVVDAGLLAKLEIEQWDRVSNTNLRGCWLVSREFVKNLAGRKGAIVNVSSVLGQSVQQGTGAYCAAKAGLIHLTRQMAVEWAAKGVRVNALLPGYFHTEISGEYLDSERGTQMVTAIPQQRLGELPDLSGPILLLVSHASRYMTGTTVCVDGGLSIPVV